MSEPVEQIRLTVSETPLGHWTTQVWTDDLLLAESAPTDRETADGTLLDIDYQLGNAICEECGRFIRQVVSVEYVDGRMIVFGTCGDER